MVSPNKQLSVALCHLIVWFDRQVLLDGDFESNRRGVKDMKITMMIGHIFRFGSVILLLMPLTALANMPPINKGVYLHLLPFYLWYGAVPWFLFGILYRRNKLGVLTSILLGALTTLVLYAAWYAWAEWILFGDKFEYNIFLVLATGISVPWIIFSLLLLKVVEKKASAVGHGFLMTLLLIGLLIGNLLLL